MIKNHLKQLVSKYPVTSDQDAVAHLLDYAEGVLTASGMPYVKRLNYNGVHSLYASTNPTKHAKILLQSHIDVVPGENQPFLEHDGKYLGRGVYDMLFAAASFLQIVEELSEDISELDFAVMLSGDEEYGGFNSIKPFLEEGYTADICILPDAGDKYGSLSVGAKGMYGATVKINGRAHHGSRPWEGDGAAAKLVRFLAELEGVFDTSDRYNSTLTVAMLNAGEVDNQGPNSAEAVLDIRYKDKADLARIKQEMKALMDKYDGEIISTIEGDDYHLDTANPLVKSFIEMYEEQYGDEIQQTLAFGSSDARFFAAKDIPVIMLRPDGGGAHGDKEWISIESTNEYYQLIKSYVLQTASVKELAKEALILEKV